MSNAAPFTLLQVLPSLHSGGVERGTVDVAKAAVRAGCKSIVASSGGRMVKELEASGSLHIDLPLDQKNPLTIYRNIALLKDVIETHGVDVVDVRSRAPAWSAYYATKAADCPLITSFHGIYRTNAPFKKTYNRIMTKGTKVVAVSQFVADHLTSEYGVLPANIVVIPRGVDLAQFNPAEITESRLVALRTQWGLKEHRPVIFMPGRFTRWKGQSFLLDALSRIDLPFYCVMAGEMWLHPKYVEELQAKIVEYKLESKVILSEAIADMPAAYALSHVVAVPSLEPEAFGRISIEAQAMGRPVVATDIGGSRETVVRGETGRLVGTTTSAELADGLKKGISLAPATLKSLGATTREHVTRHFSLALMCDRTLDLYRQVVNDSGA